MLSQNAETGLTMTAPAYVLMQFARLRWWEDQSPVQRQRRFFMRLSVYNSISRAMLQPEHGIFQLIEYYLRFN